MGDGELGATLGCTLRLFQPRVQVIYCVYIQPETQPAKQPQLMFWKVYLRGLGDLGMEFFWCFGFLGD